VEPESDEHVIRCSECGRGLIVRDNINDGVAFLSHLKNDHGIFYTPQRMTETRQRKRGEVNKQTLADPDSSTQHDR
jgi:hypothetical protein